MKTKEIIDSFNYAIEGILYVLRGQRNMRIHFAAALIVLMLSLFTSISRFELLVLFLTISLVIVMEMVNTAVETVVDLYTDQYNPLARIAKNVAAGAVLVAAINAIGVGYFIFIDELSPLSLDLFLRIRQVPVHLTFILLVIMLLVVVTVKAFTGSLDRHFLQGGMPSGHAAIAFSITTMVAFFSQNALISSLVLLLALLVSQSRIEARIHSLLEVILGAIMGVLITVLFFQIWS